MVFACESAVVVKARDGRTVLLQSRGMDYQVASLAAGEAMAALQAAAQGPEPWDIFRVNGRSSTQAVPLLSGRVGVLDSKFAVTYHVAGGLIFLLVTPSSANVFSCVALINSMVRVVAMAPGDGKSLEITAERLYRRFGEVYLAVDHLLYSGGVLEANAALLRAVASLEHLNYKDKGRAASEAPRTPPQQQQQKRTGRTTRRTLQGALDQLALLSFHTDAVMGASLQPRPGFQLAETSMTAAAPGLLAQQRAAVVAPDPFAPQGGAGGLGAPAASLELDDDFFGLGSSTKKAADPTKPVKPQDADPNDPFAASDIFCLAPPAVAEKRDAAATAAATAKKDDAVAGFEDNAFGDAAVFAAPDAATTATPAPLIPTEPVLRLAELWRGEAAGGRLIRVGLSGRVEWVSEAAKAKVHTVQFTVQVPEASGEHLAAALSTARRHPECCKPGPRAAGVLVAEGILAKKHRAAPLLCYHLPPVAVQPPPVQAHLGASLQPTQDGRHLVTLGLHYAISPGVAQRTAEMSVEIVVPALLEHPLRARPSGAVFDAKSRAMQWQQSGPVTVLDNSGNAAQPFVASFVVEKAVADEVALTAALARLSAKISLRGADGSGTLSGAALAQGVVELESRPAQCGWRAECTATP